MENKPDYFIEEFWYSFKGSMKNFYRNKTLQRPIDLWSSQLNILQKKEKYGKIENKIRNYISLYAIDLMRDMDNYQMGILITNIKRWNKISNNYNFSDSESEYHNIIFLLVDIYKTLMYKIDDKMKNIFLQVELIIINRDFTQLIIYAIENNKPSILEKISKFCDINDIITDLFDVDFVNGTSYKKIINKISSELELI